MAESGSLKVKGRSLSQQAVLDGIATNSRSAVLEEAEAFPEERLGLKRAYSVPNTYRLSSSRSTSTTAKHSFKIQLPPRDFFNAYISSFPPTGQLIPHKQEQRKLFPAATMLDSPTIEGQGEMPSIITPLTTPQHERTSHPSAQKTVHDTGIQNSQFFSAQLRSRPATDMDSTMSGTPTDAEKLGTLQDGSGITESFGVSSSTATASGGALHRDLNTTEHWLEEALKVSVLELTETPSVRGTIKVVAQTLPSPIYFPPPKPEEPDLAPTTAFPSLMSALQDKLLTGSTQYIQVTHAVPANFALTSLPSSPPTTPGITNPQEDYFTSRVFSSAVALVDRHDTFTRRNDNTIIPLLHSPNLAVPPSSTDFALLERYIPPSSAQEFMDLFSLGGPSILADRLVELSPDGGTLLFIHPTKAGAETFKTDYLSPILDPILRSVITSHCLSLDIGVELGTMASVDHLVSFESLRRKINMLLRKLSHGTGTTSKTLYNILHANISTVHVHRKVWTQWYLKQEAPKIRHVTTEYLRRARKQIGNENVNQVMLMRSIVEGVEQRDYGHGGNPEEQGGIEVGVFVIKRSK